MVSGSATAVGESEQAPVHNHPARAVAQLRKRTDAHRAQLRKRQVAVTVSVQCVECGVQGAKLSDRGFAQHTRYAEHVVQVHWRLVHEHCLDGVASRASGCATSAALG